MASSSSGAGAGNYSGAPGPGAPAHMFDEEGAYQWNRREGEGKDYQHSYDYFGGFLGADAVEEKRKKEKLKGKLHLEVVLPNGVGCALNVVTGATATTEEKGMDANRQQIIEKVGGGRLVGVVRIVPWSDGSRLVSGITFSSPAREFFRVCLSEMKPYPGNQDEAVPAFLGNVRRSGMWGLGEASKVAVTSVWGVWPGKPRDVGVDRPQRHHCARRNESQSRRLGVVDESGSAVMFAYQVRASTLPAFACPLAAPPLDTMVHDESAASLVVSLSADLLHPGLPIVGRYERIKWWRTCCSKIRRA